MTSFICSLPVVRDVYHSFYNEDKGEIVAPTNTDWNKMGRKIESLDLFGFATITGSVGGSNMLWAFAPPATRFARIALIASGLFGMAIGRDMAITASNLKNFALEQYVINYVNNAFAIPQMISKEEFQNNLAKATRKSTIIFSVASKIAETINDQMPAKSADDNAEGGS